MLTYDDLKKSIINGEIDMIASIVDALLKRGGDPMEIMSDGINDSMVLVGDKMSNGEMFIPEVLASAQAAKIGIELLRSKMSEEMLSKQDTYKIIIGTVYEDIHNIGKDMVSMILETVGFTLVDLGVNVPTDKFIEAVRKEHPDIVAMSALLTTTMIRMKDVIEALKSNNLRKKVKVIIGGAPVSQAFADSIGADGYAPDAVTACKKVLQLVNS